MTIYLDIIFFENLFMNYIILFATETILKSQFKIIRTFLSSLIGSVYAVLTYVTDMEIYSSILLKIILSMSMVYIAFNSKNLKSFFKQLIIFYLTSFTFGGVAFAFVYFVNPQNILFEKGVQITTYPIKIILVAGIIGFLIITTAFKNIKGKLRKKDMFCNIKIIINSKSVYVKAIIDTGNFLKEPITQTPVVVVQKNVLKGVIPSYILENIEDIINGKSVNLYEYISKIRIIPFTSLGKENGVLLGIKADKILVEAEDKYIDINNVIIGIYDGILEKNKRYMALLGLELLENKKVESLSF